MSSSSRTQRGSASQTIVADALVSDGWPYALPTGAGRQGTDVTGTPGIVWEVKARRDFRPLEAMRQARSHVKAGEVPVNVMRCDGQGPASIDEWPAFVPFGVLRRLLRLAGYGDPIDDEGQVAA